MTAPVLRVISASPFETSYGFCRAVRVGDRVLVAGTAPIWPGPDCPEDAGAQARRCFEIITAALEETGARLEHVVRTRMYIVDAADAAAIGAVHGELFSGVRPTATMVVVAGLLDPRWKVEIEAEAIVPGPRTGEQAERVTSEAKGDSSAPKGDSSAPQGESSAPQGESSAPEGESSAPEGESSAPVAGMMVYFTDQWAKKRYRGERFAYHVMRDCPSGRRIKREHRRSAELPVAGRKPCVECSALAAAWLRLPAATPTRTVL